MSGWWVVLSFLVGCFGWAVCEILKRFLYRRRPPKDTAVLLERISAAAHPLIEARLAVAWHESEMSKIIDDLPPVFEDQVMLSAQLGQAIEQSVMREVQRQGLPIVRLKGGPAVGYDGWISKWLRRDPEPQAVVEAVVESVPLPPRLPQEGSPSMPPPFLRTSRSQSGGPFMIPAPGGGWMPRRVS